MAKWIVFDWGDTVMRDDPRYSGPMVDWEHVEGMPGIEMTLMELKSRHQLALATNAAGSGEMRVRGALRRLDLEKYFDAVFTAREMGLQKPDPAYFRYVVEHLGCEANNAVMVGDSYTKDIEGAKAGGMRAVWYNFNRTACPTDLPVQDAEIWNLTQLPAALQTLTLPDIPACLCLLDAHHAPEGVLRHSTTVARTAYRLAVWLAACGETVNPILAHRGGLLHDLDKIEARQANRVHGELSADILNEEGQPQLAEIARRHLINTILTPENGPRTWEEKLVYYSDKVVEFDTVVGMDARITALLGRYEQYGDSIRASVPALQKIQTEICGRLGVSPEEMLAQVSKETKD